MGMKFWTGFGLGSGAGVGLGALGNSYFSRHRRGLSIITAALIGGTVYFAGNRINDYAKQSHKDEHELEMMKARHDSAEAARKFELMKEGKFPVDSRQSDAKLLEDQVMENDQMKSDYQILVQKTGSELDGLMKKYDSRIGMELQRIRNQQSNIADRVIPTVTNYGRPSNIALNVDRDARAYMPIQKAEFPRHDIIIDERTNSVYVQRYDETLVEGAPASLPATLNIPEGYYNVWNIKQSQVLGQEAIFFDINNRERCLTAAGPNNEYLKDVESRNNICKTGVRVSQPVYEKIAQLTKESIGNGVPQRFIVVR